jgi:hypothetical protein
VGKGKGMAAPTGAASRSGSSLSTSMVKCHRRMASPTEEEEGVLRQWVCSRWAPSNGVVGLIGG